MRKRIVVEGNAIYEIDEACMKELEKQKEKEKKKPPKEEKK